MKNNGFCRHAFLIVAISCLFSASQSDFTTVSGGSASTVATAIITSLSPGQDAISAKLEPNQLT